MSAPADQHADDRNEEHFVALLVAYDEALAAGRPADVGPVPPTLLSRLLGARDCLRRLEARWPRSHWATVRAPGEHSGWCELPARVGRYELKAELGRGGMGVVFRAWQDDLRRSVAVNSTALG
jgi:hypothetical protein